MDAEFSAGTRGGHGRIVTQGHADFIGSCPPGMKSARFGLGAARSSGRSKPLTTAEVVVGAGHPGWATTNHVIGKLKASGPRCRGRRRQRYQTQRVRRARARSGAPCRSGGYASQVAWTACRAVSLSTGRPRLPIADERSRGPTRRTVFTDPATGRERAIRVLSSWAILRRVRSVSAGGCHGHDGPAQQLIQCMRKRDAHTVDGVATGSVFPMVGRYHAVT